jgi:TonB family protein
MSHSPLLSRHTPGAPQPPAFLPLPPIPTTFAVTAADGDEIVETLRGTIAAGASAIDPILTAIAEAAQTLTGATAAVVALRNNGVVVCRARSGEAAPEVGSQLSEKSGISGECLRTGKTLRCDDTQKDYRVNPEVCRRLGLRSIAVLPLRSRMEIAGVLEAFSGRAYAFGEAQMTMLGRLAELVEAAYTQELSVTSKAQPAESVKKAADLVPASQPWTHPNESALRRLGAHVTSAELRADKRGRSRIAIAAGLLIVASAITWRISVKPRQEVTPAATQAQTQVQPAAAPADDSIAISLNDLTPAAEREPSVEPGTSIAADRNRQERESEPEVSDVVTRKLNPATEAAAAGPTAPAEQGGTLVSSSLREPIPAPKLETIAASGSGALGSLLDSPTAVPKLSLPISQGVSGGVLKHRIEPIYPQQAMALKLEGPVKLEATVSPEGKVGKVKLANGNPILAQAAIDAVRKWRYSPYELNGKPISVQAEIVFNFTVPAK